MNKENPQRELRVFSLKCSFLDADCLEDVKVHHQHSVFDRNTLLNEQQFLIEAVRLASSRMCLVRVLCDDCDLLVDLIEKLLSALGRAFESAGVAIQDSKYSAEV